MCGEHFKQGPRTEKDKNRKKAERLKGEETKKLNRKINIS